MDEKTWTPEDIGTKGRRAKVWVNRDGMTMEATDKDVAFHAIATVLGGLFGGLYAGEAPISDDSHLRLMQRATQLWADIPDNPRLDGQTVILVNGADTDTTTAIGYAYVRPAAGGHECGGALFDTRDHSYRLIQAHPVHLTKQSLRRRRAY